MGGMDLEYRLVEALKRRSEPFIPTDVLEFGKLRTPHMFMIVYDSERWVNPRIVPYSEGINLPGGAVVLNYGQGAFEGGKAFQHPDGELYTFRLDENARRMNSSADILCMPHVPDEIFIEGTHRLLDVDRLWFPHQEGASLYIRPVLIGIDDSLGVKESKKYIFMIFLSPSGYYYPGGFKQPQQFLLTKKFKRAAPGGTGTAKAIGNYAASLFPGRFARQLGCTQVIYLNVSNTEIEEAGANNYIQVRRGVVEIPEFTDTILPSITARSVLDLCKKLGIHAVQRRIPYDEWLESIKSRETTETGGLGTAAVVTPISKYRIEDMLDEPPLIVADGGIGEKLRALYNELTGIQTGVIEAPPGWLQKVERRHKG